jgi:hypothetical protein
LTLTKQSERSIYTVKIKIYCRDRRRPITVPFLFIFRSVPLASLFGPRASSVLNLPPNFITVLKRPDTPKGQTLLETLKNGYKIKKTLGALGGKKDASGEKIGTVTAQNHYLII